MKNTNLRLLRIKAKIEEMFSNKIDLADTKDEEDKNNKFYSRAIAALAIVMKTGIEVDLASMAVTDGYHDLGIDAIYNDTNQKKLILVQSKWRKDGEGSISSEEMNSFVEGLKRIINLDLKGANKKVLSKQQEVTAAIRDMDYQIEAIFCHSGHQSIDKFCATSITNLLKQVNEGDELDLLVFQELKLQDIYDYLANGQNADNIVLDDVVIEQWGTVEAPYKAYYGIIPALVVGEWFEKHGNRLFAKNIRYYKGSTEVNQGIKEVLKNEPENFFYYNNGIKILCKKITKKAAFSVGTQMGLFTLEGVSVVNGAQTTGAIGVVYHENQGNNDSLSKARVFLQIIDLGEVNEKQASQITKLSNTQNKIEGKDFASLDPQQDRLRKDLSLSNIQYFYKSGAKVDDPIHQITLDETIVSQACLSSELSIVALVKRNVGALTENIEKPPYVLLFNSGTNSFSLYNGVQVLRCVDKNIRAKEVETSGRKRLVLIHGNRFLLHLILEILKKKEGFSLQYIDIVEIEKEVETIFLEIFEKLYVAMEKCFPDAYPAHIFKNLGRLKVLQAEIDNM